MERGRTNYLRLIGVDHRALFEEADEGGAGILLRGALHGHRLSASRRAWTTCSTIVTEPEEVKGASIMLHQKVMRGDELLVEAHVQVAFVSGGGAADPSPARHEARPARRHRQGLAATISPIPGRIDGGGAAPRSWRRRGAGASCKTSSHELVQARRPRGYHHGNLKEALMRAALELIAREGAGRLHLRRCRALGRGQPGGALPAFPRPRRTDGRRGAARLRAVRRGAGARLGRRPARSVHRLRPARQGLSAISPARAGLLLGDVRGRRSARCRSATARGGRARLRGAARRRREAGGADAGARAGRRR